MPVVGSHRGSAAPARRALLAAAIAAIAAAAACAAVESARRSPGTLAGGKFSATRPPAASYGQDPTRNCPEGGVFKMIEDNVAESAKGSSGSPAKADGRLCAVADTFLGWDAAELPSESVLSFVSWHFGLPTPVNRITITTLETEDPRQIAGRLADVVSSFAANAAEPRFGAATQRVRAGMSAPGATTATTSESKAAQRGITRVVVVLQDAALEMDPVPRQLPANGEATLNGRFLGANADPKVLACDPSGKLETPPQTPGKAFRATLRCGERAGIMPVEIRAQKEGTETVVARFPVACGTSLPTSVAVPEPPKGTADVAAEERKLFERMNAARAAAGVPPIAFDDAVARVVRSYAESLRQQSQPGASAPSVDVVARLREAEVISPLVLLNPVVARTPEEGEARMLLTPIHLANILNPQATHGAAGVALAKTPEGAPEAFVADLLVRELPPVDVATVRPKLYEAVARKRADARAAPLARDPRLEEAAQKYADELAAARGNLSGDRANALVAPLYKSYRTLNVLLGAKADPMEFAEESGVLASGKVIGIGAGQGAHPVLGKNAVYVVILIGEERAAAPAKKRPARRSRG